MSSGFDIIWTKEAADGVEAIISYLEKNWGAKVTNNFLANLKEHLSLISKQPKLFRAVEGKKHIHACVIAKQVTIYYAFKNNRVEILYVFDTRQNPDRLNFD